MAGADVVGAPFDREVGGAESSRRPLALVIADEFGEDFLRELLR
jgi:hypothetical protein